MVADCSTGIVALDSGSPNGEPGEGVSRRLTPDTGNDGKHGGSPRAPIVAIPSREVMNILTWVS